MATACVAFAAAAGLGVGDVWPFALVCIFSGAALGADLTLPAALLADIGAAAEARPEGGGAGAYFGWWNLVAKLNLALAAGLALPLLDLSGYRPGVSPAEAGSLLGLVALYCGLPIVFKTVAAILAWRWRHLLESRS
jgi:Na+/melibiose symporter-like transporter